MKIKAKNDAPSLPGTAAYNLAAIDYARVVMALLIMSAHVSSLSSFSAIVNYYMHQYLARITVPFFFFCNGFFLFRPNLTGISLRQSVWKQLKKLFWMNVVWTLIYSPIFVCDILERDIGILKGCLYFVQGFVLTGIYWQLWYLPGAMLAIFLVWLALDRGVSWKGILLVSGALYAVGLCYQSWYGLVRRLPIWDIPFVYLPVKFFLRAITTTRNGLFFGFLFVALGAYFAQHPLPSLRICRIGFVVSMLVGFVEAAGVQFLGFPRAYDMYVFSTFATVFLCGALLQQPEAGHPDTKKLRKICSLIFLIHTWFNFFYRRLICKNFGAVFPILENSLFNYGIVVVCSILFALVVLHLSENEHFAWMKKFY